MATSPVEIQQLVVKSAALGYRFHTRSDTEVIVLPRRTDLPAHASAGN